MQVPNEPFLLGCYYTIFAALMISAFGLTPFTCVRSRSVGLRVACCSGMVRAACCLLPVACCLLHATDVVGLGGRR